MPRQIALFDYRLIPANPVGSCHLHLLRALCHEYRFTVFSVEFDNPCPERIRWVRVPVPTRPLALLFVAFHLMAPIVYLMYRIRTRTRFDIVQMVESNLVFGDLTYAHFCHRAYLRHHWGTSRASGIRGVLRWLDHSLHALAEPWVLGRSRKIVVPSVGLGRELSEEYPAVAGKITILPNPIDPDRLREPADFARDEFRRDLGLQPNDVALVFTALGHFERKGLPNLLEALSHVETPRVKLIVVGGTDDLVRRYRDRVVELGQGHRVQFAGMQADVRPYLWAADGFVLPSTYETFSLAAFEAAAAGLPLIVTPLHGVSELLRNGENGFLVDGSALQLASAIDRLVALTSQERQRMGGVARQGVEPYRPDVFVTGWRTCYAERAWDRVA